MSVVVLMPAHNEAERIAASVTAARSVRGVNRVIVIDDGSSDDTSGIAAAAGAEVIVMPVNVGKGGAMQAGLDAARNDADILVLLDADLGTTAAEAELLIAPVQAGSADMTIAVLPRPAGSGGFGLVKGLAKRGIAALGNGFDSHAPLSGQRALSQRAWQAAEPFASGYGAEVALTVRVLRAGLRVVEVPVSMAHAATGKDIAGFAHRGRQFLHVLGALIRLTFERH
ncbi:MAG: glycosyl transferase [Actinobacteria bacterium HGW-Actinobacteria-1]|jgi:glycosyltransferase involved in cell wall biosynthesis|nr:MAG: glycosyl transferase [Actinobacteria bacterium HGW-Actinobacteria-1]